MESEFLTELRKLRAAKDMQLRPSPYLKEEYTDEFGATHPVVLRNYQTIGIMNLLQVPHSILGDDTGLGKTLEVLSTIGYVWLKEPEFVPIILAKKSSLYQWAGETYRFMKSIEVVAADKEPHERDLIYKDFFHEYSPNRKRVLVLTYDTFFKDAEKSVVRDKSVKAPTGTKKALKLLRAEVRELEEKFKTDRESFENYFRGRDNEVEEYIKNRILEKDVGSPPGGWSQDDEMVLTSTIQKLKLLREKKVALGEAKDVVEPPKVAQGILKYVEDLKKLHPSTKIMLIMDEMHVLKNHKGQLHKLVDKLAVVSDRRIGMTATPVKNRLMEFFALFRIIRPSLFPLISHFQNAFCIVKFQPIPGGKRVPVVVGYQNLDTFAKMIEPFYLSRRKHDVAQELPELVTRELLCELTDAQEELYDLAEAGALTQGQDADVTSAEVAVAMVRVQQAANAPALIKDEEGNPYEGDSSKVDAIIEMLENELEGIKVLIFSRFEQMISLLGKEFEKKKIKYARITGKESKAEVREAARLRFQDPNSGVNVVLITTAGSESLNLQATEHVIFVESPWSIGDYIQILGRPIRIGSKHKMVVATHLVAVKQNGSKTIDHHGLKILRDKKKLFDKVAGEGIKGGLQFTESDMAMELFKEIKKSSGEAGAAVLKKVKEVVASAAKRGKSSKAKPDVKDHKEDPPVMITSLDLD